jgi:hypothetical protein
MSEVLGGTETQNLADNAILQQKQNQAMSAYNNQLRIKRDEFIAKRSQEEVNFNSWLNSVKALPEDIRSRIPFDINQLTIQSMIPEWYKEVQDKATASAQVANLNKYIEQVNQIVEQYNLEETVEHVNSFNALEGQTRAKEATV